MSITQLIGFVAVLAALGVGLVDAPRAEFPGAKAGEDRTVAGVKLCWCPPGKFLMGSPKSEPERRPGEDPTVPVEATADWGYLRLRLPADGDKGLRAWLRKMRKQEWGDVFVFFMHEDTGTGPRFAKRLLELAG